jgi:hypothetical protein
VRKVIALAAREFGQSGVIYIADELDAADMC